MTNESPVAPELPPPIYPGVVPPRRRLNPALIVVISFVAVAVVATIAAILVGALLRQASATDVKPYRFTSATYGYAVTLPGKPIVKEGKGSDGGGTEQLQWLHGGLTVTIEAEVLPVTVSAANLPTVLTDALDGGSKAIGGTNPHDQTTYSLDGVRAQSEVVDTTSAGSVYESATIKGTVIYIIVITRPTPKVQKTVVSSFTFTG